MWGKNVLEVQMPPAFSCRRMFCQFSHLMRSLTEENSLRGNQYKVVISSTFSQLHLISPVSA